MDFKEIYKFDNFANEAGISIVELNDAHSIMEMRVEERHLNGGGFAHGGALFTLCDISMAAVANYHQPISVSIQSDIRFLSTSAKGDLLRAEAVSVAGRSRMHYCRTTVTNQDGVVIAVGEGMFHVKKM